MDQSKPTESFRFRPLPPVPPSACSTQVSAPQDTSALCGPCSESDRLGGTSEPDFAPHSVSHRDSSLTFTSIGTNLPRYSAIDFSDPRLSFAQIDHWDGSDEPPAFVESSSAENQNSAPNEVETPGRPPSPAISAPAQPKRRPKFVVHKFHISGQTGRLGLGKARTDPREPWATFKLISRPPLLRSRKRLPRFIGGDMLRGCVDLQLDTPTNIHCIKLILTGRVQILVNSSSSLPFVKDHTFLDKSYDIYSKKVCSDPRWKGQCDRSKNKENDGRFYGKYSFSFSLPFPTTVEWKNSLRAARTVPTLSFDSPPSFREQNSASTIIYELGFVVTHGALKFKNKTISEIIFVPERVPGPASAKRQAAYREGAFVPGPLSDPDGWHALGPVVLSGRSGDEAVEAFCALYLAKPLSYTRGTMIPCYITFSSVNIAFLNALATPHTINCRLTRRIHHPAHNLERNDGSQKSSRGKSPASSGIVTHISKAVWWSPAKTDTPLNPKEKHLEGEVHLPKNLSPDCDFPLFTIEYAFELLPFDTPLFIPTRELDLNCGILTKDDARDNDRPLAMHKVNIATFHEHGPIPVAFTAPVEEDDPVEKKNHKAEFVPELPCISSELKGFYPTPELV